MISMSRTDYMYALKYAATQYAKKFVQTRERGFSAASHFAIFLALTAPETESLSMTFAEIEAFFAFAYNGQYTRNIGVFSAPPEIQEHFQELLSSDEVRAVTPEVFTAANSPAPSQSPAPSPAPSYGHPMNLGSASNSQVAISGGGKSSTQVTITGRDGSLIGSPPSSAIPQAVTTVEVLDPSTGRKLTRTSDGGTFQVGGLTPEEQRKAEELASATLGASPVPTPPEAETPAPKRKLFGGV